MLVQPSHIETLLRRALQQQKGDETHLAFKILVNSLIFKAIRKTQISKFKPIVGEK